jgi:uncharacterized protein YndB with AHSA1/START domain
MPPITATTEVDPPAAEVFADATDPTRFSEWQTVTSKDTRTRHTSQVGARCLATRRYGGANRPGHIPARPHRPTHDLMNTAPRHWEPGRPP